MTIEAQTDNLNQDGSITLKVGTEKETKWVRESDLGAVKGALTVKEGEVSNLQAKLADANTKYDTEHQELLKERTAIQQFEKDAGEGATLKTKVGELETELAGLKTSGEAVVTRLTDRVRKQLTEGYKVDAEKIKEMALEDLERVESTLILTGVQSVPANYDGKGQTGASPSGLEGKSPLALATLGYEKNK